MCLVVRLGGAREGWRMKGWKDGGGVEGCLEGWRDGRMKRGMESERVVLKVSKALLVNIWTDPTLPTDEDFLWKKSLSIDNTSLPLVRPGAGKVGDGKDSKTTKLEYEATAAST
jgi:hypothetical protein